MAHSKYLRWLNEDELTTKVAQRFVEFCDEEVETRSRTEHFDAEIYEDAVKLIIQHFESKDEEKADTISENSLNSDATTEDEE